MRIGICTGGGDCPGLNAAIRSIVKHATRTYDAKCFGILDSINGLLEDPPKVIPLDLNAVVDILAKGGTILGTYNRGNIYEKEDGAAQIERTLSRIEQAQLDAVIIIGGEGTQGMAKTLASHGANVIGVPKTIDNDLPGTEQTIGFSTCAELVSESVMRLRSTAESHSRTMVVEVMGRDSGFIALSGGLAGGANVILLPEIPFSYDAVVAKLNERVSMGRNFSLIVVSEGAFPEGGRQIFDGQNTGVQNLGGIGTEVATQLFKRTGIDTRYTVLGHLQRGGCPNAHDRIFASTLGHAAVELAANKKFGHVVVQQHGRITSLPYSSIKEGRRVVDENNLELKVAESIGICLGR